MAGCPAECPSTTSGCSNRSPRFSSLQPLFVVTVSNTGTWQVPIRPLNPRRDGLSTGKPKDPLRRAHWRGAPASPASVWGQNTQTHTHTHTHTHRDGDRQTHTDTDERTRTAREREREIPVCAGCQHSHCVESCRFRRLDVVGKL